jgi:hypothetical protein
MARFVPFLLLAVAEASRLTPPVIPLAVRNPYLSTWLSNARSEPWLHWPTFWTGQEVRASIASFLTCDGCFADLGA